jgi:hypothetical protein
MKGTLTITRGQTVYEFVSDHTLMGSILADLAEAERWIFDAPNRLARLDETERFRAAQPGDTIQMRTR